MGRNNHNKIRNGNFKHRHFDLESIREEIGRLQKSKEAAVLLNGVLLFLPWAVLFGFGVVVSPVYAQGGLDVSTELDTLIFVAGGVGVFVLAVVFSIMLKSKSRGKRD